MIFLLFIVLIHPSQTLEMYETTTKMVGEAISEQLRVKLDITMEAPIIILPVSSRKPFTFEANLGKATLSNDHRSTPHFAHTILTDIMSFKLSEMSLSRSRVQGEETINIIQPISFDLEITRNMEGAYKEDDLPEVKIEGTLHQVVASLSKEDYNTLIAMVLENFQEQGVLEKEAKSRSLSSRPGLALPIRSRSGTTKYSSQASLSSIRSEVLVSITKDKDDRAKLAQFNLVFKGFGLTLYQNRTDWSSADRDPRKALAGIAINSLTVDGHYLMSAALKADVKLKDMVLEDVRKTEGLDENKRITKLFEAKNVGGEKKKEMVSVKYHKSPEDMETVDVHVSSFVVVASVSYLLEIANFFVPEDLPETFGDVPEGGGLLRHEEDEDQEALPVPVGTRTVTVSGWLLLFLHEEGAQPS